MKLQVSLTSKNDAGFGVIGMFTKKVTLEKKENDTTQIVCYCRT